MIVGTPRPPHRRARRDAPVHRNDRWTSRRGRVLAIKWGVNPNSSSLGVDVTFLLVGATVVSLLAPVVGALIRLARPGRHDALPRDDSPHRP